MAPRTVEVLVAAVQRRLNSHLWWTTLTWAVALGAAATVVIGLWFVVRGHAVPSLTYPIIGMATFIAALGAWLARRIGKEDAARYTDEFFDLKDSVTSYRHFHEQGREGGFYDLQAKQTQNRTGRLEPHAIEYQAPRRGMGLAVFLVVVAVLLGLREPSEAVQQELLQANLMQEMTQASNQQLEEMVRDILEETKDTDEEEFIDSSKLKKWVDELKQTSDRKEALRQYAKLERKIQDDRARLDQKREEQMLQRAAKELDKDRASKELAKSLEQKKYDQAAKELQKLKPKDAKKLDKQRQELARLKAAAKRMAAAARNKQGQGKGNQAKSNNNNSSKSASNQSAATGANSQSKGKSSQSASSNGSKGGELGELIEDLEESIEEYDEALSDAEREESESGECSEKKLGQCSACKSRVSDCMSGLCKKLSRMAMKKRAQQKLAKLCKACSQCQSGMCSGSKPGGKSPGWGTNDAIRNEQDELIDNGQYAQLKGQKGKGPSLVTVESASDGEGTATRQHVAKARSYQRQLESFVQREDVPENVREGVKRYFEGIHEADVSAAETVEQ